MSSEKIISHASEGKTASDEAVHLGRGAVRIVPAGGLEAAIKKARKQARPLRIKLGMDPTAPDLHLGHTVVLRKLRMFQDMGHQAVLIVGDYTARIGDPSGRSKTRPDLDPADIERNLETYLEQVGRIVDVDRLEIARNSAWFKDMAFAELIKLASKVTVAQLLTRDDFRKRFDTGAAIAFHELFYPIMQAYDSVMVKADVELGGTDQTFNILLGRDMQEAFEMPGQVAMMHPILPGLDGVQKMSKSLDNYIAVCDPPKEMFGKVMRIPDCLMRDYFVLLTQFSDDEIAALLREGAHPKEAKMALAKTIVTEYHDSATAEKEVENFNRVFRDKGLPEDIPEILITELALEDDQIWIARLLTAVGFASSSSDARRLVRQGAVKINKEPVQDEQLKLKPAPGMLISVGKRRFCRLC